MANYVKMWEELGMDLETHDQLCAVLPTAFGDTYLSQENRPESMDFWDMVVADIHGIRPAELIEAQKKGQIRYLLCLRSGRNHPCCKRYCYRSVRRFPVLGTIW